MGAYNTIRSPLRCPRCGGSVEWQSKYLLYDGYVLANVMQEVDLTKNVDGEMHSTCPKCRLGLDAEIESGQVGPIKATALPAPPSLSTGSR